MLELKLGFYLFMCIFRTLDLFMRMLFGARVTLLDLFRTKDSCVLPIICHSNVNS
jgi:hypothetical protein